MSIKENWNRFGIGAYLVALCAGLVIFLTIILVYLTGVIAARQVKESIGQNLSELAFQTTDKLDRGMFERYREVQLLAARAELADPNVPLAHKRQELELMQQTYPYYAWIAITDNKGKVLVSARKLLEGVDVSQRPWFNNAYRRIHVTDVHEAVLLAKLLPNPGNEPKRFFDVAFPYSDNKGKVAGIFGVHLSWQWASEIEHSVLRPLKNRSKLDVLILSRDSVVLLGPSDLIGKTLTVASASEVNTNKAGFISEQWEDGKRYLVGYSQSQGYRTYPGLGWKVLVRQDLEEAYQPIAELQKQILIGGLLVALIFSVLGLLLSRRLVRPLHAIASSAAKIEAGEAQEISMSKGGYREIHALTDSLNSLVTRLKAKEASLCELNITLEQRVTDRTRQLTESQELLETVTDNMPALIAYIDHNERYQFNNKTYETWLKRPRQAIHGKTVREVLGEIQYGFIEPYIRQALSGKRTVFEYQKMAGDTTYYSVVTFIPHWDANGDVIGLYTMEHDVTERKNQEMLFEHFAMHDSLTGLPNRRACLERLKEAIHRADRNKKPLAVLFLDLDKFKNINDTYGHETGDQVLVAFAGCLKKSVRKTDLVARLSGDEFVIIVEGLTNGGADAIHVANKIISAMAHPILLDQPSNIMVATSIGIAIATVENLSAEALLKRADTGMYQAKRQGKNRYCVVDDDSTTDLADTQFARSDE